MHSVRLEIPLSKRAEAPDFVELEDQLSAALRAAKAGRVDGNEVGGGSWTIYMYGKCADALFEAIVPVLRACPFSDDAIVVKQFGGPLAEERTRRLWNGRFRITQRARKPGKRPRLGDILEFDCKGGVGFAHAVRRETTDEIGMRGAWVVSILRGVHKPGSTPDVGRELCRIWLPLGTAVSLGYMRAIGNTNPVSQARPDFIQAVSFDCVRASVEHDRSLYDDGFWDSLFEQRS